MMEYHSGKTPLRSTNPSDIEAPPPPTTTNGTDIFHIDREEDANNRNNIPFVLSFSNLTYSVKIRHLFNGKTSQKYHTKTILHNISGTARDGEITAVLGVSGSGKSTLIDALANRIARDSLKGSIITLNGEDVLDQSQSQSQSRSRMMKMISAYVKQDDLLYPMLTVQETFTFAAEFRLPRTLSKSMKQARVAQLINQLGLNDAANTVVGDEGHRGISGGERRRVSIGIDIIHDPILLFLDEPTSGLDSTSAFMVVKVLQRIAKSGSVVVMSIHQPSYRILGLLDKVIFLTKGRMAYNGPPSLLPKFFEQFGHPIPKSENAAEFTLDLIRQFEEDDKYKDDHHHHHHHLKQKQSGGGGDSGTNTGTIHSLVEFNNKWQHTINLQNNTHHQQQQDQQQNLNLKEAITASVARGKLVSRTSNWNNYTKVPDYANPFLTEILVLSKRSYLNSRRLPKLFIVRLIAVIVSAFIFASVYFRVDDSPTGIRARFSFLALSLAIPFYNSVEALPIFLQERYILLRETAFNSYRTSSYVVTHILTSIPGLFVLSLAFTFSTFWAVGLDAGDRGNGFVFYVLMIFASFWSGNSFVSFLATTVSHVTMGNTIVVTLMAYFVLFCGFFLSRNKIPGYWIWFHYLSLIKYPYEALLLNEFQDPSKCYMTGVQIFDNTALAAVPYQVKVDMLNSVGSSLGSALTPSTCVMRGVDVLSNEGIGAITKWNCLWITIASGCLFRILSYFVLLLCYRNKRR